MSTAPAALPVVSAPAPAVAPASGRSVVSLVLGLLGLLMFVGFAPVAWYLGAAELRDIRAGLSAAAGRDYATIGMVLGVIGTCLLGLAVLAVVVVLVIVVAALSLAGITH
jgi:hypothetical protein